MANLKLWFEVFNRIEESRSEFYGYLYVLCVLAQSQGHFKSVADLPVHGGAPPPALVAVVPGDEEHSKKDQHGKEAQRLRSLRLRCQNAVVVACYCQGIPEAALYEDIVVHVARPLWTAYTKDYKGLTSEEEVMKRYIAYAIHGQAYVIGRLWHTLRCEEFLSRNLSVSGSGKLADKDLGCYNKLRTEGFVSKAGSHWYSRRWCLLCPPPDSRSFQ